MSRERLYLFDTTLRDGAQTNGVDFTLADKLAIAGMLDELGIDYVEGGYPGANPTDTELFAQKRKFNTTFTAFGMTRRPGRSASNDPGLAALLEAKAEAICFVAKSWDYHVRVALETTLDENLASIRDSVRAAAAKGREVLLECAPIAARLDEEFGGSLYAETLAAASAALVDSAATPSARMLAAMARDWSNSYTAFVLERSRQHRAALATQPLPRAAEEHFARLAAQSLAEQARIEAADTLPFEQYRRQYLAVERLSV